MEKNARKNAAPVSQDQQIRDLNHNITGHVETERLLRADNAYKDVLLEEISHRVLNSFHLVAGMLQLQARRSNDANIKHELEIAAQRVLSLSLVHRRLYESASDIKTVNANIYLTGLCHELRQGFFSGEDTPTLSLDSVLDLDLSTDMMAVIGLLVSELVTNACKYAYKGSALGVIAVSLSRHEGQYRLVVGDEGVGLPPGFEIDGAKGLGMNIIKAQVRELGGVLKIDRAAPGVRFIIYIPEVISL